MDKVVINDSSSNVINIENNSYVIINDEVRTNNLEINIINCNAIIIDNSIVQKKNVNLINSEASIIELINNGNKKELNVTNSNSNIEYNIIDLLDENIEYSINESINSFGSISSINIASVSYKNKNKDYKVYTSNNVGGSTSEINCFGIVKSKSLLNYDITSFIKQGAKQTVVKQNSNILLFDEESIGKNNPILLIEENDVKASHGSSIGKIDDDTMFYLCSRGLSKQEATKLICLGKIQYLIDKIEDESIKESLVNKFRERMI